MRREEEVERHFPNGQFCTLLFTSFSTLLFTTIFHFPLYCVIFRPSYCTILFTSLLFVPPTPTRIKKYLFGPNFKMVKRKLVSPFTSKNWWNCSTKFERVTSAVNAYTAPSSSMTQIDAANSVLSQEERESEDRDALVDSIVRAMKYRQTSLPPKLHKSTPLTAEDEKSIMLNISSFAVSAKPLQPSSLIEGVRTHFHLGSSWDGWTWFRNFKSRHNGEFQVESVERLANYRVSTTQRYQVNIFCRQLEPVLSRVGPLNVEMKYPPQAFFNIDETILGISAGKFHLRALTSDERKVGVISYVHGQSLGSLTVCVSADGKLFMSVLVLKCGVTNDSFEAKYKGPMLKILHKTHLREDPVVYFAFNQTGMMNSELWTDLIKKFVARKNLLLPNLDTILFMDNLCAHKAFEAVLLAREENLRMFFFVPGCSHWLQPLDQWVFLEFKRVISQVMRSCVLTINETKRWRCLLLNTLPKALKIACSEELIKKSFRDVGLYPYDKKTILTRANQNMGIIESRTELERKCMSLCKDIIQKELGNAEMDELETETLEVAVKPNSIYEGYQLAQKMEEDREVKEAEENDKEEAKERLAAQKKDKEKTMEEEKRRKEEERQVERARSAHEKARKKAASLCRSCGKTWRNAGADWVECEYCQAFSVCGKCFADQEKVAALDKHEAECGGDVTIYDEN